MQFRPLGKTGKQVSILGFGSWALGGNSYGPTDDQTSLQALSHAYEQGINFFDTADIYGFGKSEKLIGETFKESSKRLKVCLATKVGWDFYHGAVKKNFSEDYIREACGESLKRLKTDYIDLYQLHNPNPNHLENERLFDVFAKLKQEGKILHFGTSIHTERDAKGVLKNGGSETIQVVYNLIDQRPADYLFPETEKANIGIIVREPLACGMLSGKYHKETVFHPKLDHRNRWPRERFAKDIEKVERIQNAFNSQRTPLVKAAIEFALFDTRVSVVIPGMKTKRHVDDHLRAVNEPSLTQKELADIRSLYQEETLFHQNQYTN